MSTKTDPVDLPSLARELGITRRQREDLLTEGLVTPVVKGVPGNRGLGTKISPEEAERLSQAVRIAAVTGIAFLIIVRLLRSGAVKPNLP